jgi:hypothetical protein
MSFGRLERTKGSEPMSDINVTPMVDVMLVLLVIFILTAPLMASSIKLDLPKTDAAKVGEFDFLLGDDPKGGKWTMRTYAGDKYLGGYSDHLPVYLNLYLGKK